VAHAKIVIDRPGLAVCELGCDLIELDVLGMDERVDLAEGQEFVARIEPEDREHGMRPEDTPACKVPVPQAAAAAIEGGVDAPAHHVVDHVGFARTRRLPVKRKAEDQHHEPGRRRQRHGERGVGAREVEGGCVRLDDRELAERCVERAHGGKCLDAVGERDLQHAGGCPERGERLHRTEDIEQGSADRRVLRSSGDHQAVRIGDQELSSRVAAVLLVNLFENAGDATCELGIGQAVVTVEARRQQVGGQVEVADDVGDRLPAMIADLYQRADRHGEQECDDQNGYRPPQRGFRIEQAPICRLRDRLREPLDRIRTCRRARRMSGRHRWPPFGMSPSPRPEGCAASLRISFI
jgi:hypothetical protein